MSWLHAFDALCGERGRAMGWLRAFDGPLSAAMLARRAASRPAPTSRIVSAPRGLVRRSFTQVAAGCKPARFARSPGGMDQSRARRRGPGPAPVCASAGCSWRIP